MLWKKKNDTPNQKNDGFLPMRLATNDETDVCIDVFGANEVTRYWPVTSDVNVAIWLSEFAVSVEHIVSSGNSETQNLRGTQLRGKGQWSWGDGKHTKPDMFQSIGLSQTGKKRLLIEEHDFEVEVLISPSDESKNVGVTLIDDLSHKVAFLFETKKFHSLLKQIQTYEINSIKLDLRLSSEKCAGFWTDSYALSKQYTPFSNTLPWNSLYVLREDALSLVDGCEQASEAFKAKYCTNERFDVCEVLAITIETKKQKLPTKNLWPD